MNAEKGTSYDGFLIKVNPGNVSIPVRVSYASKYSVFIDTGEDARIKDGEYFNRLLLDVSGNQYEFGKCAFYLDFNDAGYPGRLIFLNDIYDFNKLFYKQKLVNLETLTNDLEVILDLKKNVREEFRSYINDLTYDLKVYKHFFDDLDRKFASEPEHVREVVLNAVLNREGRKFMIFFNDKLKEMEKLISSFDREEHPSHGFYLRKQLWDIIMCSEFMVRTNIKPRGYAGDSIMMKMIYDNGYQGDSTFAKILYKISLEHPASQAVRNRRMMIARKIAELQEEHSQRSKNKFKFMSIASGCAYELQDLIISEEDIYKYQCTLLDQDKEALTEAMRNVHAIEKRIGFKFKVNYKEESVRTMLRSSDLQDKWGKFDLIYSMGLFDYLTPPVAKVVIEVMYSLLEPGGQIFIGNFHFKNISRWFMEYWHDWVLYYRNEEDFSALLKETGAQNISIIMEDSQSQMFLSAQKPFE